MSKETTWTATYVSMRHILEDFSNNKLNKERHKFFVTETEIELVDIETRYVLYSTQCWDCLYDFINLVSGLSITFNRTKPITKILK